MSEHSPVLTTITPYWNRLDMLKVWLQALKGASHPRVKHIIYFIGEHPPERYSTMVEDLPIITRVFPQSNPVSNSIGHWHNEGAKSANTEWIMKLDVDCLPNVDYFGALLPILAQAKEREWFNGGMFYVNRRASDGMLNYSSMPVSNRTYNTIMGSPLSFSNCTYLLPGATNFICRRADYLSMGGCQGGFKGYGWEDYQQIYGLEFQMLQRDPLPGTITIENVTRRCRDEISRRKAKELWERNKLLCLLHRFHEPSKTPGYRNAMEANKKILWDYIIRYGLLSHGKK